MTRRSPFPVLFEVHLSDQFPTLIIDVIPHLRERGRRVHRSRNSARASATSCSDASPRARELVVPNLAARASLAIELLRVHALTTREQGPAVYAARDGAVRLAGVARARERVVAS